jgi:hypothetical protein
MSLLYHSDSWHGAIASIAAVGVSLIKLWGDTNSSLKKKTILGLQFYTAADGVNIIILRGVGVHTMSIRDMDMHGVGMHGVGFAVCVSSSQACAMDICIAIRGWRGRVQRRHAQQDVYSETFMT